MPTLPELSAQVDALQAALDAEQQEIADAIAALQTANADLVLLVAAGGTEAERQAVSDKITAAIEDLQGTINATPPPPPEG